MVMGNKDKRSYSQYYTHIHTTMANLISVYVIVRTQRFHVIRNTFSPDSKISKYMGESSQDYS